MKTYRVNLALAVALLGALFGPWSVAVAKATLPTVLVEPAISDRELMEISADPVSAAELEPQVVQFRMMMDQLEMADEDAAENRHGLVVDICVSCTRQFLSVSLFGRKVLDEVLVSARRDVRGLFRPGIMKKRIAMSAASRRLQRPVFVEWAIQVDKHRYLYAASREDQLETLGKPIAGRAASGIRVDRDQIGVVYALLARFKDRAEIRLR